MAGRLISLDKRDLLQRLARQPQVNPARRVLVDETGVKTDLSTAPTRLRYMKIALVWP